ncbi:Flagellar hook-associated protein FlgL [hydrothermal vent metagenome]|uniref:Flagellar hook-associated protein FlgL n=1 Tax=hydrothermal vent metagenome TaxID=652676 RepID=A0A3B0YF85_9ZZZZ
MRISTKQLANAGLNNILNQQTRLNKTQGQLATGLRIQKPSDDPAGATRVLGFKKTIQQTEQYQANIDTARQYLDIEESSLNSIVTNLQRVRELAIQANSDTQTANTRSIIADEVNERLEELLSLANTRNANGEFIFSGFQGQTQPFSRAAGNTFVYNGDQGQRFLQVSPSRQIISGDSGSDVFLQIRNGNGTFNTQDNNLNTGVGIISQGVVTDATIIDGDRYNLIFPNTTTASNTLTFNDVVGTNDNLDYNLQINGTTVYSVDETGTPINSLSALATQINLSSGTTNVRAYVDAGVLYLGNTSPSNTGIVINETLSGLSAGDGDTLTGYFGTTLTEAAPSNITTLAVGAADRYLVEDSQGNIETSGAFQSGGVINFNGQQVSVTGIPQNGDIFTISPSNNQSVFTTVQNLAEVLRGGSTNSTNFHNLMNDVLADLDLAQESLVSTRSNLGSRQNALDNQFDLNDDSILRFKSTVSNLEDIDYASAVSDLNLQLVGLQAAQQAYSRVQNLSLFNFL